MQTTTMTMLVLAIVTCAIAFKFAPLGLQVVVYAFWVLLGVIEIIWKRIYGYTVSSEFWQWMEDPSVPLWQRILASAGTVGLIGVAITIHLIYRV